MDNSTSLIQKWAKKKRFPFQLIRFNWPLLLRIAHSYNSITSIADFFNEKMHAINLMCELVIERASDQPSPDFVGASSDAVEFGIPEIPSSGILIRVPISAKALNRLQ